jgi:hypothetical protein
MPSLSFKYLEDKQWFDLLLQGVENRENLFDFRDPQIKREEYNLIKHQLKLAKIAKIGKVCELHIAGVCDLSSGLVLDHLIPLSSNELNLVQDLHICCTILNLLSTSNLLACNVDIDSEGVEKHALHTQ